MIGILASVLDSKRVSSIYEGTSTLSPIAGHKHYAEGIVVGGTSAEAAMMPDVMIVDGDSEANPRVNVVEMGPGMGFLPGVVIDQHFLQRGRLGRLISALAQ